MHMADALISPAVGGIMLAASTGTIAYSVGKLKDGLEEKKIPLMGVMGAFVFSAQMINFTIPATGASGHLGGGLLLAALIGPYAGFLVMTSVLVIQALFFGDGGLLALGCNVFNLGFFTCFIAYPLIYKPLQRKGLSAKTITLGTIAAVIVGLQLGAFGVVLETLISGKTALPFTTFVLLMQPIHLAIGLVEGIVASAVLCFIFRFSPEILENALTDKRSVKTQLKKILIILIILTMITGGLLSWFASENPDGLEWVLNKATNTVDSEAPMGLEAVISDIQNRLALLPDYNFRTDDSGMPTRTGTSTSGIVGSLLTLGVVGLIGLVATKIKRKAHVKNNHQSK